MRRWDRCGTRDGLWPAHIPVGNPRFGCLFDRGVADRDLDEVALGHRLEQLGWRGQVCVTNVLRISLIALRSFCPVGEPLHVDILRLKSSTTSNSDDLGN